MSKNVGMDEISDRESPLIKRGGFRIPPSSTNCNLFDETMGKSLQNDTSNYPIQNKKILNLKMAAKYMDISTSHLYKLTSTNRIEFYRPMGKLIYFHIDQLDAFLMQNRIRSVDEINIEVSNFKLNHKNKVS